MMMGVLLGKKNEAADDGVQEEEEEAAGGPGIGIVSIIVVAVSVVDTAANNVIGSGRG